MALQIRRGTDSQRQGITPKAGEPIFTTDTKKLYIGDGSTAGGIVVDTTGNQLTDVLDDTSPQLGGPLDLNNQNITGTGNINITGQISASAIDLKGSIFADDSTLLIDGIAGRIVGPVVADVTGNVAGNVTGNVIATDSAVIVNATSKTITGSLSGNVTGDVQGSVFSDSSTLLVDGVNSEILGTFKGANVDTEKVTINLDSTIKRDAIQMTGLTTGAPGMNVDFFASRGSSTSSPAVVQAGDTIGNVVGHGWDGDSYTNAAIIKVGVDKYTSSIADGVIPGRILFLTFDESGNTGANNAMCFNRLGNLGIKRDDPAEALDVVGNAIISGNLTAGAIKGSLTADDSTIIVDGTTGAITAPSYVQFGSFTTAQRDALTAANGMVIYNSQLNKFQGYENGSWANLI
tara:strand:+ start:390 stop:1601 length:1212 start_codon:yes stop_codon:yes gene_type:complete